MTTKTTASVSTNPITRDGTIVFGITGAAGTPGGIASANLNVLKTLQALSRDSGKRLKVVSLHENSANRPGLLDSNVEFIGCLSNRFLFTLSILKSFRPGCIYLFDHVRLALPITPLIAIGFRDFVIFAHGSESWKRARQSSKWLFSRARFCLTNSQFTLRGMQDTFSGFDGRSCLLGLPLNHTESSPGIDGQVKPHLLPAVDGQIQRLNNRVILLVGRMDSREREKGHCELLRIWSDVLRRFPDAQLVFAGPGDDQSSLIKIAEAKGIASSVFIPGFLPVNVLKEYYRHCYAFVMPSRQEGFGLVYLEAMNAGKPCIGCIGGGGEEIIEDGKTGILLENSFSDQRLLEAILQLLEDATLARRMGREGQRRLREKFTTDHACDRLHRVLKELFQ